MNRIKPLDGLRVFAAFGVVWIHTWTLCGNPAFKIGSLDIYKSVAVVGNGVDFFFVISGFFMYTVLSKKVFSGENYLIFLQKRFKRIAPAFYVSAVVYCIVFLVNNLHYPFVEKLVLNMLFLNNFFSGAEIIGPFWSLCTEWHFYIILPFLFYKTGNRFFIKALLILTVLSFIFILLMNSSILNERFWDKQIPVRFIEFVPGVVAAYFYQKKQAVPGWLSGAKGILLACAITYIGRMLMVKEVIHSFGNGGWLMKSLSMPVMTFGFGILVFLVISEQSFFSRFLSFQPMQFLGKISYSVYLWHSLILMFVPKNWPGHFSPVLIFMIVSVLTSILSYISYKFFEQPYFQSASKLKLASE